MTKTVDANARYLLFSVVHDFWGAGWHGGWGRDSQWVEWKAYLVVSLLKPHFLPLLQLWFLTYMLFQAEFQALSYFPS